MYVGSWKIDDYLTFSANTHRADTGAATDGDGVPTYRIYEDETGTPLLTGSMAKLDDANTTGFYSERVQLTAASGFEQGKSYTIYVEVTVNSVVGTMSHSFQMKAEVSLDGHTAQTGDSYAIVNSGTYGNAKLARTDALDFGLTAITDDTRNIPPLPATEGKQDTIINKTDNLPASPAGVGSAMNLAADAIKAVSFDETTAFPVKATDSGDTQIARKGADSDTLKVISDEITALNNISTAQVNAEVDAAFNTAIPGAPTAHSINERVKSMDDLTQASGGGDLAAVKAKTDNIPTSPATEAKQNDLKTQIGTAGAGLTDVGMFSQSNTELSGIPTTTSSLKAMIQFLFEFWRNKKETKDDLQKLYKEDSSTTLGTRTLADDTVTLTEGKMG